MLILCYLVVHRSIMIARLQRTQHALARVMTQQSSRSWSLTSTDLLKQPHWLPIEWRIMFKLGLNLQCITYRSSAIPRRPFTVSQAHEVFRWAANAAVWGVHLPVHWLSVHGTTFYLVLVLFVSLHRKYGIPYLLTFCNLQSQTLSSVRRH